MVSLSALHCFITIYQIQVLLRIVLWHYNTKAEPQNLGEEEGVPFENACHAVIIASNSDRLRKGASLTFVTGITKGTTTFMRMRQMKVLCSKGI